MKKSASGPDKPPAGAVCSIPMGTPLQVIMYDFQ